MSMEIHTQKFLTPTYQTMLITALQNILNRCNEGSTIGAWISIEAAFNAALPPDVVKELQAEFNELHRKIIQSTRRMRNTDPLLEQVGMSQELTKLLRMQLLPFVMKIKNSLYEKGYLEKAGAQPRFRERRKLTVDEDDT